MKYPGLGLPPSSNPHCGFPWRCQPSKTHRRRDVAASLPLRALSPCHLKCGPRNANPKSYSWRKGFHGHINLEITVCPILFWRCTGHVMVKTVDIMKWSSEEPYWGLFPSGSCISTGNGCFYHEVAVEGGKPFQNNNVVDSCWVFFLNNSFSMLSVSYFLQSCHHHSEVWALWQIRQPDLEMLRNLPEVPRLVIGRVGTWTE